LSGTPFDRENSIFQTELRSKKSGNGRRKCVLKKFNKYTLDEVKRRPKNSK
jgi:hypothetical protein